MYPLVYRIAPLGRRSTATRSSSAIFLLDLRHVDRRSAVPGGGDLHFVHVRLDQLQAAPPLVCLAGTGAVLARFFRIESPSAVADPDVDSALVAVRRAGES